MFSGRRVGEDSVAHIAARQRISVYDIVPQAQVIGNDCRHRLNSGRIHLSELLDPAENIVELRHHRFHFGIAGSDTCKGRDLAHGNMIYRHDWADSAAIACGQALHGSKLVLNMHSIRNGAFAMTELNRRAMMGATLTAAAALPALAAAQSGAPAVPVFTPRPLPFDPKTITGLSEKLLSSHHGNNYVSAVKRLGSIQGEFAKLDLATAPNFIVNGLKREELIAQNSMVLHEIYFSCLGVANQPGRKLAGAIEKSFGSMDKWRAEYVAMGKALGGGSGWVVLNWMERDQRLVNQWANDHTMAFAGGTPVLVLDMFEHAYAMDFGSKAAAYVDAYMNALNWTGADARFARLVGHV